MTMPPYFCNKCNRIVQDGERHSCFFYKNDEIVFNLQQPDETEVDRNRDETTGKVAKYFDDKNGNEFETAERVGDASQASTSSVHSVSCTRNKEMDGGSFVEHVDSAHRAFAEDASFPAPDRKRKLDRGAEQPLDLRKVADAVPGPSTTRHQTIGSDGKRLYVCDKCSYRSKHKGSFDSHYKTHTMEKPHVCDTCAKCFSQKGSLNRHERTHTGEKPHVCEKCGKGFAEKHNLTTHLRMHSGEKPYKCDICGKKFSNSSNRKTHLAIHKDENPHKCHICGREFSQKKNCTRHLATHKMEKPYAGDFCDERFSSIRRRSSHDQTREEGKRYTCGTCGETFSSNEDRNRHFREKHQ